MSSPDAIREFRTLWLPHATDAGLQRLADLLDRGSPLLIRGAFTAALPMGCLATHLGWHHPRTQAFQCDAGIRWLTKVARLNPATSEVILAWDKSGPFDFALRTELLAACRTELERREQVVEEYEVAHA